MPLDSAIELLTFLLWEISNARVWGGWLSDPSSREHHPALTSDVWARLVMSAHRPFFLMQTDTRTHTPAPGDFKASPGESILSFINVPETQVHGSYHTAIRFSCLRSARC